MGRGLVEAASHILGSRPPQLEVLAVDDDHKTPEDFYQQTRNAVTRLQQGDGVLILADIFGSSHTNAACRAVETGHVELVSGVSLPMLVRVLNHRRLALKDLVQKATSGGSEGIVCASRHNKTDPDAA
jgi:PTS system ascorbate-specific IIA component